MSNDDVRRSVPALGGWRQRLRSTEAAAAAGLVAAIGWAVAFASLLSVPSLEASDTQILEYYRQGSVGPRALWSMQVLIFATIGFIWFIAVIRGRIGADEPKLFGTVFLGAGILLAALLFVGTAALAAPSVLASESGRTIDPDSAAMTRSFAVIILAVVIPRIASLFVFSLSGLALRTGALPRWFILVSYTFGVAMFVNVTFATPNVYAFPAWIGVVSAVMLIRRHPPSLAVPGQVADTSP